MVVDNMDIDGFDNSDSHIDSFHDSAEDIEGHRFVAGQNHLEAPSLTYDDLTRILVVSTMRPVICCQRTISRACGYIIRPEVRFPQFTGRAAQYLESLGVEPREVYAKPEEITRVLSITKGMDEFVSDMDSLNLVRKLNGRLKQPKDHNGVIEALEMIEQAILCEP